MIIDSPRESEVPTRDAWLLYRLPSEVLSRVTSDSYVALACICSLNIFRCLALHASGDVRHARLISRVESCFQLTGKLCNEVIKSAELRPSPSNCLLTIHYFIGASFTRLSTRSHWRRNISRVPLITLTIIQTLAVAFR